MEPFTLMPKGTHAGNIDMASLSDKHEINSMKSVQDGRRQGVFCDTGPLLHARNNYFVKTKQIVCANRDAEVCVQPWRFSGMALAFTRFSPNDAQLRPDAHNMLHALGHGKGWTKSIHASLFT